jgi:SpoVK/Ycf46/Vps4 family AAA+-type ATPase
VAGPTAAASSGVAAEQGTYFPRWAQEMREIFRGGTISQFVLHGSVFDLVAFQEPGKPREFRPLPDFLANCLFGPFDVVVHYNRGLGVRPLRGREEFTRYLKQLDEWSGTSYSLAGGASIRAPHEALEFLDRFLLFARQRTVVEGNQALHRPLRVAVILDFAQFLVPAGEAQVTERNAEVLIRLLSWASDPALLEAQHATVLVTENLADLARMLIESPYNAKLRLSLPDDTECLDYLRHLACVYPDLEQRSELSLEALASKLVGLTRINILHVISQTLSNDRPLTAVAMARLKKELIEKECYGLLDFLEPTTCLDDVAGCHEAKTWLREDASLLSRGQYASLPMGYLITGRIGTGKTWLTCCYAGEVGVPFVALKNFRDKWQGATEGNLEKIFNVLRALGQVMVFIDEADQMAGKRTSGDGDGGVSGRVYGLLAKEMSNTRNRGRILWIFATSRPDLLEVDLKRPGRLDVHIPLFPPQDDAQRHELFVSMARKVGLPLPAEEVPPLPAGLDLGTNEMEALLVRAMRTYNLRAETERGSLAAAVREVMDGYRPLAHTRNLEYMDLIAVKECTDTRFLPEKYRDLDAEALDARLNDLKQQLGL